MSILRKKLLGCCCLFYLFFLFSFFIHTCSKVEGSVGLVRGPAGTGPGSTPRSTLRSQGPITIKATRILLTLPHTDSRAGGRSQQTLPSKKGLKKKKKKKENPNPLRKKQPNDLEPPRRRIKIAEWQANKQMTFWSRHWDCNGDSGALPWVTHTRRKRRSPEGSCSLQQFASGSLLSVATYPTQTLLGGVPWG